MKYVDVLQTEFKEQENQYRWIGQMQNAVITFYAAVAAFSMLAVTALRPQASTPIDLPWPGGVMIAVGILGILVTVGLFHSRTMQRRTAWYLGLLLVQMAKETDDYAPAKNSALLQRSLCTTRDRFRLLDTMNVVTLIAFYSAVAFIITGVFVLLVVWNVLSLIIAVLIGFVIWAILAASAPKLIQHFMNKETERMKKECKNPPETLEEMLERSGIPVNP